jgi:hypothetical protein
MEQTECSETSAYKIQTPGNYPEENIQHTEHGESLKSRIHILLMKAHHKAKYSLRGVETVCPVLSYIKVR